MAGKLAEPLSDRSLKFRRAQRRVREVQRIFWAYAKSGAHKPVQDPNTKLLGVHVLRQPQVSLSVSLGDALQDLKSALDHAVYELARLN